VRWPRVRIEWAYLLITVTKTSAGLSASHGIDILHVRGLLNTKECCQLLRDVRVGQSEGPEAASRAEERRYQVCRGDPVAQSGLGAGQTVLGQVLNECASQCAHAGLAKHRSAGLQALHLGSVALAAGHDMSRSRGALGVHGVEWVSHSWCSRWASTSCTCEV